MKKNFANSFKNKVSRVEQTDTQNDTQYNTQNDDGIAERAACLTGDLMVGSSIPAVAQGYLIFPAQKDERHQGAHP